MSADQIAEIAPMVREVFVAAAAGTQTLCATFQISGAAGAWAQVTAGELNVAYPRWTHPGDELREILAALPFARLIAWEPGRYATWSFSNPEPRNIAAIVDRMFQKLFSPGDYSVDCQLEIL